MANQILVNLKEALTNSTSPNGWESYMDRYNGGWTKTVTALDKSKDNGYSLIGNFVQRTDSIAHQSPGLYLDCDIGGSRKNQIKFYTLFVLNVDGSTDLLKTFKHTPDWAVKCWPEIETYFANIGTAPEPVKSEPEQFIYSNPAMEGQKVTPDARNLLRENGKVYWYYRYTASTLNSPETHSYMECKVIDGQLVGVIPPIIVVKTAN